MSRVARLLPLLPLIALVACGGAVDTDGESIETSLGEKNGGYDDQKEAPAFGDPAAEGLPEFGDALAGDEALMTKSAELDGQAGVRRYRVVLLWGRLPFVKDQDPGRERHDWTGNVSLLEDAGAIIHARTIKFDKRDAVESRTATQIGFTSHTRPHVDGLLLDLRLPASAPQRLRFSTTSLTTDLDLALLDHQVGGVFPISDGSGLLFAGYEDIPECRRGLLFGKWKSKPNGKRGRFVGRVVDGDGGDNGWVQGIYGKPKGDARTIFFGKSITKDGDARALLSGTTDDGRAEGRWSAVQASDPLPHGNVEVIASDNGKKGVWFGRFSQCPH